MATGVAQSRPHGTRHRVLTLHGELDVAAATSVLKRLIGLDLRLGQRLVLDLRDVQFIDSTGIRLLLQARAHAERAGAAFTVVAGPPAVMRVLRLVGLDDQLDVVREP
jgi:anti-sigma B factor antagonist